MDRKSLRCDVLSGLFHIGAGNAADMLSEIVQKRIGLQIPGLELAASPDGALKPEERFRESFGAKLMVSTASFSGWITGSASLVFPAGKMRRFVALCSQQGALEPENSDFTDVDFDVIREICNIVLNSILGELKKLLNVSLSCGLPRVTVCDRTAFDKNTASGGLRPVLALSVVFLVEELETRGAVVIDLTADSSRELFRRLDEIEAEL